MDKKNCGQVTIPTVDNTSPCDDFTYAQCVIVDRESNFIDHIPNNNLNEYLILLEDKLRRMELTLRALENNILNNTPQV
jgi:hypothetical protein